METITLHDVEGWWHKTGVDRDGCIWREFEVDYFAGQEPGECAICGAELDSGWMCLDGGGEVCHSHVEFAENNEDA